MTRVSIDSGLLQMIVNGLKRDADGGHKIRGEWIQEIEKDARPIPAEPVNARLVEALKAMLDGVDCSDYGEEGIDCPSPITHKAGSACPVCNARDALAAAEAQQAGPNTDPADMVNRAFQDGINSGYAQAMMDEMARHRQAEPEIVEGAPCRNALWRDGKPFPKSSCQRCGTLLRPGWKCADGVEV